MDKAKAQPPQSNDPVNGVPVDEQQETVGELTERLVSSSEHSADLLRVIAGVLSLLATITAVIATLTSASHHVGNGVSVLAAFVATAASVTLGSAIALVSYLRERAQSRKEKPLSPALRTLQAQLAALRMPVLQRSSTADPQE